MKYRYFIVDKREFIRLFSDLETKSDVALMFGQLIATSVTTFIQLPSDQVPKTLHVIVMELNITN